MYLFFSVRHSNNCYTNNYQEGFSPNLLNIHLRGRAFLSFDKYHKYSGGGGGGGENKNKDASKRPFCSWGEATERTGSFSGWNESRAISAPNQIVAFWRKKKKKKNTTVFHWQWVMFVIFAFKLSPGTPSLTFLCILYHFGFRFVTFVFFPEGIERGREPFVFAINAVFKR